VSAQAMRIISMAATPIQSNFDNYILALPGESDESHEHRNRSADHISKQSRYSFGRCGHANKPGPPR